MSFPHRTSLEIRRIEKAFYRHFTDLIVESIRSFSISSKELNERMTVSNLDQLKAFVAQGKSVCGIIGHMGNWEWAIQKLALDADFPVRALYQPTSNKGFDNWLRKNRERFGASLVSTRSMRSLLKEMERHPIALGTLGDQTPVHVDRSHWMTFLHQPTPIYTGTEKMARNHNMVVFYISIHKSGRGYYHLRFDLITDDASKMEEHEITETHTRLLELSIVKQPEIWLWTAQTVEKESLETNSFSIISR